MYNNFDEFATFDNNIAVCLDFDDAHSLTIDDGNDDDDSEKDNDDEKDDGHVHGAPSREKVFEALEILKSYAATNDISTSLFECINKISYDCAYNLKTNTSKQTNIKSYYKRQ